MARFDHRKTDRKLKRLILPIGLFALSIALFLGGISSVSDGSDRRQKESLENALRRGIVYCYANEGRYPESLEDLRENYAISYDEDRFCVDYTTIGSNIYPDVTIIDREEQE